MKRICITIALLLSAGWAYGVSAHTQEVEHEIKAVLHIVPDDQVVVGKTTELQLDFSEAGDDFVLANCDCVVSLSRPDKEIFHEAVGTEKVRRDKELVIFSFTFLDSGSYTLTVAGKSLSRTSFEAFTLNYDIEAGSVPDSNNAIVASNASMPVHEAHTSIWEHAWHLSAFIGAALLVIILVLRQQRQDKNKL